MSIEYEMNISEIALLQKNLEDNCLHTSGTEIRKAQQLFNKKMKGEIGSLYDVKGL